MGVISLWYPCLLLPSPEEAWGEGQTLMSNPTTPALLVLWRRDCVFNNTSFTYCVQRDSWALSADLTKMQKTKKNLVSFILHRDVFREYRLHLRFAKSLGPYKYCWMIWNVKNFKISHLSLHGHRLSVFLKLFWSILPKASLCSSAEQLWAINLVVLRQSPDKVACRHVRWEVGRKPFNLETCLGLFLKQNKQLLFWCT